jgi:hypothetical protein
VARERSTTVSNRRDDPVPTPARGIPNLLPGRVGGSRRTATGKELPPRRVRVTSPRMTSAPRPQRLQPTREIDELTEVGEVYMRSLLRTQLRLGLTVLAVVVLTLAGMPLLFAALPELGRVHLLGVPVPWLVLGVLVYPALFAAAWWHVRLAERAEGDFTAILDRQ